MEVLDFYLGFLSWISVLDFSLGIQPEMIRRIAYQLTVTRYGSSPGPGLLRQLSGKRAILGSTAKNAAK
ncbi:hypothetical protein [Bradyrhizobium sp. CER78]|uniref:hypothetical protein n=1 Tax=Bradyrhizobium sp. CER78 TaxID=3039162 RepID=UPI002446BC76|nr:hypothetical protein [Bradyrhizobium sp. CER78]MDH2386858.1 hypothetical protein [Bradyrhizobium sp. CER78]